MTNVEIRLLGAVAVERDGVAETRRSRNHGAILGMLALHAGEAVDGDLLIDEAWGEKLPLNPRGALQIALTRVRAWLGERTEPWITAAGGLYTLHLARDAVDVLRFHRLAADALRGQDLARFEEARHAWRGTPFPGHDSDRLSEARRTAEQRRRTLTVRHARLLLDRDRPADVVDLLAGEDRLDEELSALLVRALRDGGRPRDAVETYLEVRRRLRDELDVEPGPELRSLYGSLVSRRPPRARRQGPEIVGRETVAQPILDALHDDGRMIVLHGRAGAGKSTVLRAVVHAATARGARTATSAWGENAAPCAPWHEVAADLGIRGAVPDRDLGPWLHDQLGRLARDAPLLLALDDAHRADTASLDVLRALARRGLPAGVVVVVAARSPDAVEHPHWDRALADLTGHDAVTTTELGPLAPDAVAALVRRRLAHLDPGDDLTAAVADRSGGLALHVSALLDLLRRCVTSEEALRAVVEVPGQVRAVVEHQAAQLPPPTRRAVEALAVLRPIDLAGLAAVLGRRPLEVADALEVAVRAGPRRGGVRPLRAAPRPRRRRPAGRRAPGARRAPAPRPARGPARRGRRVHRAPPHRGRRDAAAGTAGGDGAGGRRDRVVPAPGDARGAGAARRGPAGVPDDDRARPARVPRALPVGARDRPGVRRRPRRGRSTRPSRAGDDELAVLVAVGDEPLGLSVQGEPRRLARLHRLLDRPARVRCCRLDLLAAYLREARRPRTTGPRRSRRSPGTSRTPSRRDDPHTPGPRPDPGGPQPSSTAPSRPSSGWPSPPTPIAWRSATGDPALHLDAIELLMSAELTVGHTERAHELRQELEATAERWFRPRSIWAAQVTEAAMLTAEGDPGADEAANRAAARGAELGLPGAPLAAGAHLLVQRLLVGSAADLGELGALAAHASAQSPNTAAWAAAAAYAEACAGHDGQRPRAPRRVLPPRGQPGHVVRPGGRRRRGGRSLRPPRRGGRGRRPRTDARRPGRRRARRVRRRGPRAGDAVDGARGLDPRRRRRGPSGALRGPRLRRPRRLAAVVGGAPASS